eukprot:3509626-Alexandrium_andersonii.AAC.1
MLNGVLAAHARSPARGLPGQQAPGKVRVDVRAESGRPRPATENGTRTWGGQPGSESIGQARPNPWWWGPPFAGSTP